MGVQKDQVIFVRELWNDEAAAYIVPLIEPIVLEKFKRDVNSDRAILWRVQGDDWQTWLITRIEQFECGHTELVLEVIAGKNARDIVSALKEKVKCLGVKSIRFETFHPEKIAARFIGSVGFKRAATIFRCDL